MGARESGPAPGSAPSSRGSPGVEEEAAGEGDEDEDNGEVQLELLVLIFVSKPGWTDTRAGWGRFGGSRQAPPWNRFQPCTPKCGRLRGGHPHLLGLLAQQCHVDIAQNQAQVQPGSGKQTRALTPHLALGAGPISGCCVSQNTSPPAPCLLRGKPTPLPLPPHSAPSLQQVLCRTVQSWGPSAPTTACARIHTGSHQPGTSLGFPSEPTESTTLFMPQPPIAPTHRSPWPVITSTAQVPQHFSATDSLRPKKSQA